MVEHQLAERALREARTRYEALEAAVDGRRLLARLRVERPHHPILWAHRILVAVTWLFGLATAAAAVATLASMELAVRVARFEIDAALPLPLPVMLLALTSCVGAIGTSTRWFAERRGRRSPLLPWEERRRLELAEEIARLHRQGAEGYRPPAAVAEQDRLVEAL